MRENPWKESQQLLAVNVSIVENDSIKVVSSTKNDFTLVPGNEIKSEPENRVTNIFFIRSKGLSSRNCDGASKSNLGWFTERNVWREKLLISEMNLFQTLKVSASYSTGNGAFMAYDLARDLPTKVFVGSTTKSADLARIIHAPIKI